MKRLSALPFLCSFMMLCGCNGVGDKDTLLARINDEKVYQEDENILLKSMPSAKNMTRKALLYEHVLGKAALVSRALSEYPELEAEWDQYYKDIDVRILMMLFQRVYVMECLTYTDEELRAFYEANTGRISCSVRGARAVFRRTCCAAAGRSSGCSTVPGIPGWARRGRTSACSSGG